MLAKLENTAAPDQVASFALTLLQGLTTFKEKVLAEKAVTEDSKAEVLADLGRLIETAADQHEIYSLVPAARATEGQRKDDPLRM